MSQTLNIDSSFHLGQSFDDYGPVRLSDADVVKNEPMFFNASVQYALEHGGPITKAFLTRFLFERTEEGVSHWLTLAHQREFMLEQAVFDSRVHMLMPGWYPCIPGFHHDDVPRGTRDGQPDYTTPAYRSQHCMGLVNGHICPTEFAVGASKFKLPTRGIVYKTWHKEVERKLKRGELKSEMAPSGRLIYFDDRAWHQGTMAVANGWRWFGRVSWHTDRAKTITNEIRRQVQVYMPNPMEGW